MKLYTAHTSALFRNWDSTRIQRLFSMPAIFFIMFLISCITSTLDRPYPSPTIFLYMLASLLGLLMAIHIHYMMVRSGMIPFIFAKPQSNEFHTLVGDILVHDEFIKLKNYHHHTNHIYDHVVRVSYIAYAVSKVCGLDYKAAARGGLLHDFFLYDWRERKATDISRALHGKEHPQIALENARQHFEVSELEEDIILKHMFPKTRPAPRYLESAVVSFSDKVSTLYEYAHHYAGRLAKTN
jgi:uncharacterized protein